MSLSQNPWLGHMSGSMANVNTYTCHGQNVISSKPFNKKDANTVSQIAQRASFKLMLKAYRSFGGCLRTNFPDKLVTESAYNFFMRINLPEAIDKTGTVPVIDYSKLVVSQGGLPPVKVLTAVAGAAGITLSYKTNLQIADVSETDQVVAFGKTNEGELIIARQVRGIQEVSSILIPYAGISADDMVCCYLMVTSEDGKQVSDSTYVVVS
ncbi:MAG: DUF6266 family protein [Paludibacter sp.]|nr:DUF6266 family protein [Paludibacter sp.]